MASVRLLPPLWVSSAQASLVGSPGGSLNCHPHYHRNWPDCGSVCGVGSRGPCRDEASWRGEAGSWSPLAPAPPCPCCWGLPVVPLATEPQGSVFGDLQWAHSAWSCLSVSCTCLRGQEPSSETGAAQPGPEPALVSSSSSQRVTLKASLGTRTWDRGLLPAMASSLTPSSCALEAPGRCTSNSLEAMIGLYAVGVQQNERNWGWAYVDPRE